MKVRAIERGLFHLSESVYFPFVPIADPRAVSGARTYLRDLWSGYRWNIAFVHTAICAFMYFLPVLILGKAKTLPMLGAAERELFLKRILESRLYPLRLLGYGVKGHALMAVLRDASLRRDLGHHTPLTQLSETALESR